MENNKLKPSLKDVKHLEMRKKGYKRKLADTFVEEGGGGEIGPKYQKSSLKDFKSMSKLSLIEARNMDYFDDKDYEAALSSEPTACNL